MKENFFNSMFSEGGKISHKRVISFLWALAVGGVAGSVITLLIKSLLKI